jgi:hypothetical protein
VETPFALPYKLVLAPMPRQLPSRVYFGVNDDRRKLRTILPKRQQLGLGELIDAVVRRATMGVDEPSNQSTLRAGAPPLAPQKLQQRYAPKRPGYEVVLDGLEDRS